LGKQTNRVTGERTGELGHQGSKGMQLGPGSPGQTSGNWP